MRAAAALCAVLLALVTSAPAWAHAALTGSDPADGARLATAPERVALTYNQDVEPQFASVTITGPDGAQHGRGAPDVQGPDVHLATDGLGTAGVYVIAYRVISADGHPINGQVTFELTRAVSAAPPASTPSSASPSTSAVAAPIAAPDNDSGGFPVWPVIVGIAVIVAAGIVFAGRRVGRG